MNRSNEVDTQAKRLIRATEEPIRLLLGVGRLDQELIGMLYLKVRDSVERWQQRSPNATGEEQGLIDETALAIYLTAIAWQSNPRPAIQVLPAIRQRVAASLGESRVEGREREVVP